MSTSDVLFSVSKPEKIPGTIRVQIRNSVTRFTGRDTLEAGGRLHFMIGPNHSHSPSISRQLAFSTEQKPKLRFPYIEAGKIRLNNRDVYLLLETN